MIRIGEPLCVVQDRSCLADRDFDQAPHGVNPRP